MKKNFLLIPLILFFFIIAILFYVLLIEKNPSELPSALINQKAPTFQVPSLVNKKNFISVEEFGNETTVVNFFATWCAPCRAEHLYINRLSKDKGIKIIGINFKDDPKQALKWLEELGNPYSNVAVDSDGSIGMDWGVYGLPETFIVNEKSIIKYRHVGPITKEVYNDFHKKILESNK